MEQNGIWQEDFKIDASMVDTTRKATLMSICNFLQVIAGNHAHEHQLGFDDMNVQNRFWVLNRLKVEMKTYPVWRSEVTIHTWVHLMKGPFSYRNFELFQNGQLIGHATTLWVAVDSNTKRPVRVSANTLPIINKIPKTGEASKLKFQPDNQEISIFQHRVVYSDLDMVLHVNNVKYIEWILNSYERNDDITNPKSLEVNYLSETHGNQSVNIQTYSSATKTYLHEIQLSDTSKAVLRAKLEWH